MVERGEAADPRHVHQHYAQHHTFGTITPPTRPPLTALPARGACRAPDHSEIRSFFNGVLGIEDPDVFTPPAFKCKPFPPPPPPPPGPAPPAPPNPTRDCVRGLELKCGKVQHTTACPKCVSEYGPEFKCTAVEDRQFCETPRPLQCTCRANTNAEAAAFSIRTRIASPGMCCDICEQCQ